VPHSIGEPFTEHRGRISPGRVFGLRGDHGPDQGEREEDPPGQCEHQRGDRERAEQVDPDQPEEGGLPRVTELDGLLADDLRRELQDETDEQGGDREGEKTT
jgi:hypothetical protein